VLEVGWLGSHEVIEEREELKRERESLKREKINVEIYFPSGCG